MCKSQAEATAFPFADLKIARHPRRWRRNRDGPLLPPQVLDSRLRHVLFLSLRFCTWLPARVLIKRGCFCFVFFFNGANICSTNAARLERARRKTRARQSEMFFSLGDLFFSFFLHPSGVACIRKHLAGMCGERGREGGRGESVACFVFQRCLPDCLWESE